MTFSDVTLVWEAIPCLKQNGDITGYSVRYAKDKSNEYNMNVFGGNVTQATISGLDPSTNHSIQVAGVNAAGTGEYSDPLSLTTRKSELYSKEMQQLLWATVTINRNLIASFFTAIFSNISKLVLTCRRIPCE